MASTWDLMAGVTSTLRPCAAHRTDRRLNIILGGMPAPFAGGCRGRQKQHTCTMIFTVVPASADARMGAIARPDRAARRLGKSRCWFAAKHDLGRLGAAALARTLILQSTNLGSGTLPHWKARAILEPRQPKATKTSAVWFVEACCSVTLRGGCNTELLSEDCPDYVHAHRFHT